jgi:hypothetical protein
VDDESTETEADEEGNVLPISDKMLIYQRALRRYTNAVASGEVVPPSPPHIDRHPLASRLRQAWWHTGMTTTNTAGRHYPTCSCATCVARHGPICPCLPCQLRRRQSGR